RQAVDQLGDRALGVDGAGEGLARDEVLALVDGVRLDALQVDRAEAVGGQVAHVPPSRGSGRAGAGRSSARARMSAVADGGSSSAATVSVDQRAPARADTSASSLTASLAVTTTRATPSSRAWASI